MSSGSIHRLPAYTAAFFLGAFLLGATAVTAFAQNVGPTSPLDDKGAACNLKKLGDGQNLLACNAGFLVMFVEFGDDALDYDGHIYTPLYAPELPANRVFQKYEDILAPPVYDAAHFSAKALATYRKMGFKPRNEGLKVRITREVGGESRGNSGHNPVTGMITLNLNAITNARNAECVLAHESFHEMQQTSVPVDGTISKQRVWWMEATAEYAAFLSCGRYPPEHKNPPPNYFRLSLLRHQKPSGWTVLGREVDLGLRDDEYGVYAHEYFGAEFIRFLVERGAARGSSEGAEVTNLSYFRDLWKAVCQGATEEDFTDSDVPERIDAFLKSKHGTSVALQEEYISYVVEKLFRQNYIHPPDWHKVVQNETTLAEDAHESTITVDLSDALSAQVSALTVSGDKPRRLKLTVDGKIEKGVKVFAHTGTKLMSTAGITELLAGKTWEVEVQPNTQIFVLAVNGSADNFDPAPITVNVDGEAESLGDLRGLIGQLGRLALELSVVVTPAEPRGPYQITAAVTEEAEAKQEQILEAIRTVIRQSGYEPVIDIDNLWSGPSESENGEFDVDAPGQYPIKLTRHIRVSAKGGRGADQLSGLAKLPSVQETATAGVAAAPENLAGEWKGNLVIVRMPLIEGLDQAPPGDDFVVQACAAAMQQLSAYKGKPLTLIATLVPSDAGSGKMTISVSPPGDQQAAGNAQELAYQLDRGVFNASMASEGQAITMSGNFTPNTVENKIAEWTLSGSWRVYGVGQSGRVEAMNGTWSVSRPEPK